MSDPGFSIGAAPDPQWWRREPDEAAAVADQTQGELLSTDAAGSSLPFWAHSSSSAITTCWLHPYFRRSSQLSACITRPSLASLTSRFERT